MSAFLLSSCVGRFIAWCESTRRPATVAMYRHQLKRFERFAGNIDVRGITPALVESFSSKFHAVRSVKRLLAWMHRHERTLTVDPLAGMRRPRQGQRHRTGTRAELLALLRGADRIFRPLLLFLRESWCRPQEARAVRWCDLASVGGRSGPAALHDGAGAFFVLASAKGYDRRDDDFGERVIPISPRAARLLLRLSRYATSDSSHVFLDSRGRPWTANGVRCRFRRLRAALGVGRDRRGETIVPYTFRHTGATAAAAAGVRDFLLAESLGHASPRTTKRYVHLKPADVIDALKSVWELKTRDRSKNDRLGLRRTHSD